MSRTYAAIGNGQHNVLADTRNEAPVFPDQDPEMEGRQTAQERTVPENHRLQAVRPIGDPVT